MVTNYFQATAADDPLVSPIYGSLDDLPPLLIQAGRSEVLVDDATRLDARAKAAGLDVTCELYDERLHIFSLYAFLPNAGRALDSVAGFVARIGGTGE